MSLTKLGQGLFSLWILGIFYLNKFSLASLYKIQGYFNIVMSSILIMNQAFLNLLLPIQDK